MGNIVSSRIWCFTCGSVSCYVCECVCVSACGTDAVASVRLTCPVGVLHVYFNSSSIAEVSPHLVFSGRRAKVAHGVPRVFFLRADTHTHTRAHVVLHTGGFIELIHTYIRYLLV